MLITDEEPAATTTARRVLIVPVRADAGARVVRLCRDPLGARVLVAFTSVARLRAVLGVEQEWIRLGAGAARSLADEIGVERMLVDPGLSAPPVHRAWGEAGQAAEESGPDARAVPAAGVAEAAPVAGDARVARAVPVAPAPYVAQIARVARAAEVARGGGPDRVADVECGHSVTPLAPTRPGAVKSGSRTLRSRSDGGGPRTAATVSTSASAVSVSAPGAGTWDPQALGVLRVILVVAVLSVVFSLFA
ncbi:SAV_915 family protein [Embleya hyalina]|uniref:SAV_915 family protein n=1 Tax=Embleya hyalina TaxID=516124 RepID=UPI0015822B85|nr:SAV_915 family protein [Embleya hyalina]